MIRANGYHTPATDERLPPQNLDAERSVLGSILRWNRCLDDVLLILRPEHFYTDAHQKIFVGMLDLHEDRKPIDTVVLAELLHSRGQIEDIGGYSILAELWDSEPTGANAVHYAKIVREKASLRGLIHVGSEIVQRSYDPPGPAAELIRDAERALFAVGESASDAKNVFLSEAVASASDLIDERAAAGDVLPGISTGFEPLDDLLCGFQPRELTIIAARPSVGKTTVALALLRHYVANGGTALFVSLEQHSTALASRLMAAEAQVNSHALRRGRLTGAEWGRLCDARNALRSRRLIISDDSTQSVSKIAANARRLRASEKIGLVVLDYVQLIDPEDKRANREEQVGHAGRRLKALAKDIGVPVVALAQLNREVENRQGGKPRLADLRDSGQLEQHADVVWLLHNPTASAGEMPSAWVDLTVHVAKNRDGQCGEVKLMHNRAEMRFAVPSIVGAFPRGA